MRTLRACLATLAVLALATPAAARAQRDTIRLGGEGQPPRDSITLAQPDTAPQPERPSRWSRPFAVEGSGEVAPRPPAREAVWLPADTVRARRRATRRDSAAAAGDALAAADSSADADSSASSDASDTAEAPPPARRGRTAASRDSASTGRRTTTRTARDDTAAARRRTASADDGDETPPAARATRRTTAARDSAATAARRAASRDTAGTRRTAARDTAATRRATSARPRTHTVAAHETLFGIARRYGVTSAQIRAVNPDLGETLEIGTVLRLPAGARAPASRADAAADERDRPAAPRRTSTASDDDGQPPTRRPAADRDEAPRPAARGARRHTVVAGETLYGLARKFGVTVDAIRRANRLESDTLRPGQALVIPAAPPQR